MDISHANDFWTLIAFVTWVDEVDIAAKSTTFFDSSQRNASAQMQGECEARTEPKKTYKLKTGKTIGLFRKLRFVLRWTILIFDPLHSFAKSISVDLHRLKIES